MYPSPKQAFLNYPLGIRYTLLMHYEDPDFPSFYNEALRLENTIVERNIKGHEYEKQGLFNEAIAIYEKNILDFPDTPAPYDRLRIIYAKRKQYVEAIRVCEAFVAMCKKSSDAVLKELKDEKLAQQMADAGKFPEYINKLKAKLTTKPLIPRT